MTDLAHTLRQLYSVISIPTLRRKVMERQGEKSEKIVGVLTMVVSLDCGDEAAQAASLLGRKRFGGRKREEP